MRPKIKTGHFSWLSLLRQDKNIGKIAIKQAHQILVEQYVRQARQDHAETIISFSRQREDACPCANHV